MADKKTKKCKICSSEFFVERFNQKTCDYKCAIILAKQNQAEKVKKEWKLEKAVLKDKLKTLGEYEADAKKSFQKWVRLRDKDMPCISCGTTTSDLYDGGHYFKAELFSGLIFDPRNCHKQCRKCNRFLGGNEIQYRLGLVQRFGIDFVEQLETDSVGKRIYKFSKEELVAKKIQFDILIKENNFVY